MKAQKVRRKGVQIVSVKSKFVVPNTVIDWIRGSPQPLVHVDTTCGSDTILSCEQQVLENNLQGAGVFLPLRLSDPTK